ncbi:MAG: hypothetical protein B6242_10710 [Anaerolineaceae bacterium 4572_78]|nr:MAG: hypothetical protein B6242_10710 [Anaerolineaceae bacterium 4572_78]
MVRKSYVSTMFLSLFLGLLFIFFAMISLQSVMASSEDITNHADVVIQTENGEVIIRRITFTHKVISGLEALMLTNLDIITSQTDFGTLVCSIEATGCPADDCFCSSSFWNYLYLQDETWNAYDVGADSSTVGNNHVQGWAWGEWGITPPNITTETLAARAGLQWLKSWQHDDGSINGQFGSSVDALLAIGAMNDDLSNWTSTAGNTILDYVKNSARENLDTSGNIGKLAMAVASVHADPRNFAGLDLVISMTAHLDTTTYVYGSTNWDQALSILGLKASGEIIPITTSQVLIDRINDDGGWGWMAEIGSDTNSTAIVLQALVSSRQSVTATAIISGLAYIESARNADGGFSYVPDSSSEVNSTAYVVQGLLATGQYPLQVNDTWAMTNPISFLLNQQESDGGFIYVQPPANLLATMQAIPALTGKPFPILNKSVATRGGSSFWRKIYFYQ